MGAKLLVRPIFQPNSYAVELRTVYTVGEESVSDRHIAGTWTELGSPMWGLLTVLSALMFTVSVWHLFPVKRERSVENTVSITDIGQYFETYLIRGSTDCPLTISPKDRRYEILFFPVQSTDSLQLMCFGKAPSGLLDELSGIASKYGGRCRPVNPMAQDAYYVCEINGVPETKELNNILWSIATLIRKYQSCDEMIIEVRET
jgi:hypothetical protein